MTLSRSTKLISAAVGIAAYFAVMFWLKHSYVELPRPPGEAVYLGRDFRRSSPDGFFYSVRLPAFRQYADTESDKRSPILLYENDKLLGPAHSPQDQIERVGLGRYVHWGENMLFSTSDNSNPNTNGRNYWAVKPK